MTTEQSPEWLIENADHGIAFEVACASALQRLLTENAELQQQLEAIGAGGVGPLMPATVQPQREPMTDEEITEITFELLKVGASMHEFARAIERAHGIGGDA